MISIKARKRFIAPLVFISDLMDCGFFGLVLALDAQWNNSADS